VVNINVAVGIFADTVGVAIGDVGRQFAPIMGDFVFVIAFADNRFLGTRFVVGS
jgi:hypothetical protein